MIVYSAIAWVHQDDADDYPIEVTFDEESGAVADDYDDACAIVVEMLKQLGSKDLTDYKVFENVR